MWVEITSTIFMWASVASSGGPRRGRPPRPIFDRWNEKVERTEGCWLWRGAIQNKGYGVINRGRRDEGIVLAHRFAYEHFVGPIPEGLEIGHTCDTPACVNPEHLVPVTHAENMEQMAVRDRQKMRRKLDADQVRAIRADPRGSTTVAREYGMTAQAILDVRARRTWRHVP